MVEEPILLFRKTYKCSCLLHTHIVANNNAERQTSGKQKKNLQIENVRNNWPPSQHAWSTETMKYFPANILMLQYSGTCDISPFIKLQIPPSDMLCRDGRDGNTARTDLVGGE